MTTSAITPAAITSAITTPPLPRADLPVDMLERFRARAGELDRFNAYFHEDLAELRDVGYLCALLCPSTAADGGSTSPR